MNPLSPRSPVPHRLTAAVLAALEILAANGFIVKTGTAAFSARTLQEGTGIDITNPDGVAGDPTISVDLSELVIDHGSLAGLGDDDHPHYLTEARGDLLYSQLGHTHLLAGITDVTISAANLNTLDDGANTTLHFHSADRARANHTGTQTAATISDFTEAAQDAVLAVLTDSATIDFTYTDGTNSLTASVIQSALDHGSIGGLTDDDHTQYHTDARALTWLGTRSTADLPEGANLYFTNERVDDRVNALLVAGTGISLSYDDVAGTLTVTNTDGGLTTEEVQDIIGAMVTGNTETGIAVTYDDAGAKLNFVLDTSGNWSGTFDSLEGSAYLARANHTGTQLLATISDVTISAANLNILDNGADTTLHFHAADRARANHTGTQLASTISDFAEAVDDRVTALIVAGTGITKTYNDGANTLTLASSITQYTDELAQDAVGAMLVDSATIDFTYTDATPALTASVKADSISNTLLSNMAQSTIKGRAAGAGTGDPTDLTAAQVRTLINVEDGATADQTAAEILAALLTVDGPGSGLNADLLDGLSSAAFSLAGHTHPAANIEYILSANVSIASDENYVTVEELEIPNGIEVNIEDGGVLAVL